MNPFSPLWRQLLRKFDPRHSSILFLEVTEELMRSLQELAECEQRSREEVAIDLLSLGISNRREAEESLNIWKSLSPRVQQAVALTCLGYTNMEIAKRMGISPETVKAHILRAVYRFGVRGKSELRSILANWNFSNWDS